ncbi:phosphatidate phosphatase PAH2-like [Salvia hispanica]|uniref:phosphatidate phosphatase PAH2-like n=1 Tax=Salvia hispanica TaxID=49212 RepID=UPI00200971F6|nr:phosphatidate phosphatase PAH2-like [Salvia hispanica]
MQAVGKLGSYISKSVYTVSGTFHPFGGAVDIIVVEQPDGSYKSSPWYVQFGKFQGVLKMKEKVVGISVNDVEADFNMHLDSKGEAFFLEDIEAAEEGECGASSPHSSGEETEGKPRWLMKSKSCTCDSGLFEPVVAEEKVLSRTNTRKSNLFGIFGKRSPAEEAVQGKENADDANVEGSLEVAEMAADLLDLRWSTNLGSPKCKKDDCEPLSDADTLRKVVKKSPLFDGSSHDEISLMKSNVEANGVTSEYTVSPSVDSVGEYTTLTKLEPVISELGLNKSDLQLSSVVSEATKSDTDIDDCIARLNSLSDANFSVEENGRDNSHSFCSSVELEGSSKEKIRPFCHKECREVCIYSGDHFTVVHEEKMSVSGGTSNGVPADVHTILEDNDKIVYDPHIERCTVPPSVGASTVSEEDLCLFGEMDGLRPAAKRLELSETDHEGKEASDFLLMRRVAGQDTESSDAKCCSISSLEKSETNDYTNDVCLDPRMLSSMSNDVRVTETGNVSIRTARSLPIMDSVSNTLEVTDPSHLSNASLNPDVDVCTEKDDQPPGAQRTAGEPPKPGYPPKSGDTLLGTGGKGHFRRSTATKIPDVMDSSEKASDLDISNGPSDVESGTNVTKVKGTKKKVKTLTPTSKHLQSLQLKEGKNVVIFTFSTAMLGKQQVDARIFLWRWDSKIVISDVDGTITRSDLLGQVMPLVGMDWSQTGVAHLFTAIKENGYQLLFLSARSISQSYITRQFLVNIKQDGKALPDGPVVISPDGLFPSLFREVVRRAPHEFKIACLEDIRSLFPRDRNPHPFYAGFGNRDTDEVSYIKVGIPLGKIFIINPKGEIAVNRHVETKSYTSLHALVNGMFPNMFTSEQEDFNSWNFGKLSPPSDGK